MKKNEIEKLPISAGIDLKNMELLAHIFGVCLYKVNLKTKDVTLSINTTKIAGYDYDEVPRNLSSKEGMIYADDRKLVDDSYHAILSGESEYYHIQYRMRRKNGSIVWLEEIGFVSEYDKDGQPLHISGMARDLSQQKWAEEKACRIEDELRQIAIQKESTLMDENRILRATSIAGTLIVGGFHTNYEVTLHQAIQLIGESMNASHALIWRNSEHEGKLHCYLRTYWTNKSRKYVRKEDMVHLEYDSFLTNWQRALKENKYVNILASQIDKKFLDESNIIIDENSLSSTYIMLVPFHLNGEFWGMIGFVRDGNRSFVEYEARSIIVGTGVIASSISRNEALGKINLDRDQAIANTLAKGEFLSRMSHELRTPLNAIINMTNFALQEKDYQRAISHIRKANASSQLLLNIINDILDISKIEAGKFEFVKEPFNFAAMLRNADDIVRVNMEAKQQKFTIVFENELHNLIISDEHRLLQVIVNLLNNAMKFTPEHGEITLSASSRQIDNNLMRLRIEVRDSGIGMNYEQQKKLFHIFEQIDGSITRKYGGSGLGLAICKKILNALGGDIWVKSKPNQGACFYFEFDAELGEPLSLLAKSNNPENDVTGDNGDFSNRIILLAEDVEINREIIEIMLEDTGVKIVNAANGQIALDLYLQNPSAFHLILMDVQMPVMDGLTATKLIRESGCENATSIPIIAMTANAFKEDVAMCLASGMNDHIGKPINTEQTMKILEKYLKSKKI